MTAIITLIYSLAILILALGAFIGYKRGFGRATVRLVYLVVIAVIAFIAASAVSSAVTDRVMLLVHSLYNEAVSTVINANPQLEIIAKSIITAILSPVFFAVIFGVLQLLTLICLKLVSTKLVNAVTKEKSKNEKASRWLGMGVGLVSAVIMIFALFSPITFTASILANTSPETLADIDELLFANTEENTVVSLATKGVLARNDNPNNDFNLKKLRQALIVFSILSNDYEIQGSQQSAQKEISNVITAANDGLASFKASIETIPDDSLNAYLNAVAAVGANTKHSDLITTVIKESSKAVANLEPETVTKILETFTPYAESISIAIPKLFQAVADTPDEEISSTIEAIFGTPPVESARDKEKREKEESKAIKESVKESKKAEKEAGKNKDTAPTDTIAPDLTTVAPVTTAAPETTTKPETTAEPETTAAPDKKDDPDADKDKNTNKNNGIIGALIEGTKNPYGEDKTVAEKGEMLAENKALFEAIKESAMSLLTNYDITDEKYSWIFDLIRSELSTLLTAISENPNMSFSEKVVLFADALNESKEMYMTENAYAMPYIDFITSASVIQVVAIFGVDVFSIDDYPSTLVPIKDIMEFMGITSIPSWVRD